ncbi:MAG: glycoside hydrolase family 9 protein [Bacteroides sp.]|nr:glycoside hydrolase family 9 protein [Bacteroides sp.]
MKKNLWLFIALASLMALPLQADEWIRINQLGYLPQSIKVAVFMSEEGTNVKEYALVDAFTGETVRTFSTPKATGAMGGMKSTYRLDFSDFTTSGTYYLKAGKTTSPRFAINAQVYNGTADFLLNYMRQQRCGYNPFTKDSCHVHDGYILYHPTKTGQHIDVRGGWHDATDYLQYTTTSANAVYQMMFAYQQNPEAFGDAYDKDGHPGANGIPDIVDEIKWGMDWLCRMNPEPGELYNQIADDRDHAGMRQPQNDTVDYGYGPGKGRPVYFCSGEPQVRGKFMNATTGVASTAGKFASCFALGARVLKDFYPDYAATIGAKADAAYQEGVKKPGACQTASVLSPYIYEEDNWVDDMELGAVELYNMTGEKRYLEQAVEYGRREPVTPWMGADSARHYQWYPFMNMGHYHLATVKGDNRLNREFIRNMHAGIRRTYEKAVQNPFLHGIPYIWCSNNLTTAMLTQCRLYRETTGDQTYAEMEAAMLDWLFGCNPWGTSMVVELPLHGDYPIQPHSSYLNENVGTTPGGLVDGPVYATIFAKQQGVSLREAAGKTGQDYERFHAEMVYHDVIGDYATNEPTMDGVACLTYYLSSMQAEGMKQSGIQADRNIYVNDGIVRTDPTKKQLTLVFTAHDKADGADAIIATLKKHGVKGAFFFTGKFFELYPDVVKRLLAEGHYVGSHSYGHLLYMPWENRDSLLVTRQEFEADMQKSYEAMRRCGISYQDAPLYIPPYEYYNREIAAWAKSMGIQVVNYTPGTMSNADYTTPDMKNYRSSKVIYNKIMEVEKKESLNGHLMLIHFGTHDDRTDKFYNGYLDKMMKTLKRKGYRFAPLREAVGI